MASRKKGKQNRKPIKRKKSAAKIREEQWQTAYDKAAEAFYRAQSRGFIDPKHKFSTPTGEFYRKKPKTIKKESIESLKKWTLTFFEKGMMYFNPETNEWVEGKYGINIYQRSQRQLRKTVERAKREQKQSTISLPPTYDVLDVIDRLIYGMPEYVQCRRGIKVWLYDDKNILHNAMMDLIDGAETDEQENAILRYLESKLSELEEYLIGIERESEEYRVTERIGAALAILTQGAPPIALQKSITEFS